MAGAGVTLFVILFPFADFAYDNPALHLAPRADNRAAGYSRSFSLRGDRIPYSEAR